MSFDHNSSLSGVFNSINSYCQDKTAKIKSSIISKGNSVLSSGPTPKYTTMDGNVHHKPSPPIPPPRPMSRPPPPSPHFQRGENIVDQNQILPMPKLHPGMS
uniref:WH2 domain-containing protein n=1 Tax=Strongyloides papillosus TaxID=174720 RepID=A0A0N5BZZ8_STREA